jgi:hypothetical protein
MILTAKYVFAHLPKTGGSWVSTVLTSSGVPYLDTQMHLAPDEFIGAVPDRFAFTFVRHPVTWWRSYWNFTHLHRWPSSHYPFERITQVCKWHSYEAFMERVLNDMPGEYSRIVAMWTEDMHRVGRFEHLADDLVSILDEAGCPLPGPVDEPPVNVGTYSEASKTTPEIDAEIMRTEEYVISEYYGGR